MDYDKINNYIKELYSGKEEMTKNKFSENTEIKDFIPVIDDDVSRFLKIIISIKRPLNILEIGTSIGYSAVSMASEAKKYGGRVFTIEYDEKVANQALKNFEKAGLENIHLLKGDAREIMSNINEKFDLIFQDTDKKLYSELFNKCLDILNPGGLFIAEDVLFPVIDLEEKWHDLIEPIKNFNDTAVKCKYIESTILPIGDGVMLAVKK